MRKTQIADSARKAFVQGLVVVAALGVVAALVLDGGFTLRIYCTAMVAQFVTTGWILCRRPDEPTWTDRAMIRFGVVPLFAIAYLAAPWLARLLAGFGR